MMKTSVTEKTRNYPELLRSIWRDLNSDHPDDVSNLLNDPRWIDLGFQSSTPFTDFRASGMLGLASLAHFCHQYTHHASAIAKRMQSTSIQDGWYSFATVYINIVFNVAMLVLEGKARYWFYKYGSGKNTFHELAERGMIEFDKQWQRDKCTVMQFESFMKNTFMPWFEHALTERSLRLLEEDDIEQGKSALISDATLEKRHPHLRQRPSHISHH